MQETKINWTDSTWNPLSGCQAVSAGCKYCYAESLAENKRGTAAFPNGFELTLRPWKLNEPRRLKQPSLVFTNSMSDLFQKEVPDDYRDKVFATIQAFPQHRFQVLTKRPEIARDYFRARDVPSNVWLGTTIEHQLTVKRADILRDIDAPVRFISAEPLLGPIKIDLTEIHWVIGGGESGAHLSDKRIRQQRAMVRLGDRSKGEPLWVPRDDRIEWARTLRDQCEDAGAAFWWKQWGGPRPESGGRELDGRTWDELPTHVPSAMPPNYAGKVGRQLNVLY